MKKYFVNIVDLSQSNARVDQDWFSDAVKNNPTETFCKLCLALPLISEKCPDVYLDIEQGGEIPKNKTLYGIWGYGVGIISKQFVDKFPKLKEYLCFSNIYYGFDKKEVEPDYLAYVGKQTLQLSRVEKLPYLRPIYEENYEEYLKEPMCPVCGRPKPRPMEPQAKYRCLTELPKHEITTLDITQSLLVTEEIAEEIKNIGIKKLSYTKIPYLGE